jgi:two-component sensor histidine kinase
MGPERVNVLVVDDRPDGLLALSSVLDRGGYNVVTAASGYEALAQMLHHEFAVVLLDVQMPGMDGFETAERIRENPLWRDTPIVFVTAIDKEERYVRKGYECGAVDYIFKPLDPHTLESKVAVFANLYRKNLFVQKQAQSLEREIVQRREMEQKLLESLQEKDILLKEIHHRVKNNMQVISSLLRLQAEDSGNAEFLRALRDSQLRIQSMALVHQLLYQSERFDRIDLKSYLEQLTRQVLDTHRSGPVSLDSRVEVASLPLDMAIPCGLILTELVTNAFKHAFTHGMPDARLSLSFRQEGKDYRFVVGNNGRAMAETVNWEDPSTLGLRIIQLLARQLGGKAELERDPVRFTISFPVLSPVRGASRPAPVLSPEKTPA